MQLESKDWIPSLRANLQAFRLSPESFSVVSEYDAFLLEGAPLCSVLSLIDGQRSVGQIFAATAMMFGQHAVEDAVRLLMEAGYIEPADDATDEALIAFCHELNVRVPEAKALLAKRRVALVNFSSLPDDLASRMLRESGVRLADDAAFSVVLCDDYRDPRLKDFNAQALKQGRHWLLAKPAGHNYWLGPFFAPGQSPCWACLDHRLSRNRTFLNFAERESKQRELVRLNLNPIASCLYQGLGALVVQVMRIALDRSDSAEHNTLHVHDTISKRTSRHSIVRRPQCAACGNAPSLGLAYAREPEGLAPDTSLLGGLRNEPAAVTFERFAHHISPLTGLVANVDPSPYNRTTPLCVFNAGHNFALAKHSVAAVKDSLRAFSSGKGRTIDEARTSALCEALERYSGMFHGDEPHVKASYASLGKEALHPRQCLLFSDRQYAQREDSNRTCGRFQVVPGPLDDAREIEWSPVQSLDGERTAYVPTAQLYYGYPHDDGELFCWADSNGCAAGASREDAILQGLLELVERDAVAIWWYNRLDKPSRFIGDLNDSYYRRLANYYERIGRSAWVIDLTHDLGVPVYGALSRREGAATEDIVMGFGAHISPEIALNRAITELNQFLPAVLNVSADGRTEYQFDDAAALHWWQTAKVETETYLSFPPSRTRPWMERTHDPLTSATQALNLVANAVRRAGIDIYIADQSRPDVGLPVYKVIAPGLRHFWARFAPGRLYSTPVAMGELDQEKSESDLNPIAMFV